MTEDNISNIVYTYPIVDKLIVKSPMIISYGIPPLNDQHTHNQNRTYVNIPTNKTDPNFKKLLVFLDIFRYMDDYVTNQ